MDTDQPGGLMLPDSRLLTKRTVKRMEFFGRTVNAVAVYCANCGVLHGWVPEESCTFACWLCNKCADTWGAQYGAALMPDEVFWRQVRSEMLERFNRILSLKELRGFADASCSALSKLIRRGASK